jgi:hypothetical protein
MRWPPKQYPPYRWPGIGVGATVAPFGVGNGVWPGYGVGAGVAYCVTV